MLPSERKQIADEAFAKFAAKLETSHATPLLCVGIGRDPGRLKGVYVVDMVGELTPTQSYALLKSMVEHMADKLGIDPNGVS